MAEVVKLVWTRRALRQLAEAREYVAIDNPAAARAQIEKIERTINRLKAFPMLGHDGMQASTKEFAVQETPYIVVYRLLDDRQRILAVLHGARNRKPGKTRIQGRCGSK